MIIAQNLHTFLKGDYIAQEAEDGQGGDGATMSYRLDRQDYQETERVAGKWVSESDDLQ